jgi:hypothetical protein
VPPSNAEIETRWIDAWEAVHELVGGRRDVMCLLPDGTIVDVDTCLGWIQDAIYAHRSISTEKVWIQGKPGIGITVLP